MFTVFHLVHFVRPAVHQSRITMDRLHAYRAHLHFTPQAVVLRVLFVLLDISATKLAYLLAMHVLQARVVRHWALLQTHPARCARQERTL